MLSSAAASVFDMSHLPSFQPALVRNVAVSSLKRAPNPERERETERHEWLHFLSAIEHIMVDHYFNTGDQDLFDRYVQMKEQIERRQRQQDNNDLDLDMNMDMDADNGLFSFESRASPRFALEFASSISATTDDTASANPNR